MGGAKAVIAALLAASGTVCDAVVKHGQFSYNHESGVISLVHDPTLRLNLAGGELNNGDPLVLYPCAAQSHELFEVDPDSKVIRLQHSRGMCLNAEGGVANGAKIVTWHCSTTEEVDHEQFVFSGDGRIRLQKHQHMCINVEGGAMHMGGQLILYPCSEGAVAAENEGFAFADGLIKLKANSDLHFNVKGGELGTSSPVVLWNCQPGTHEIFEFFGGRLRMKHKPAMCINAEEGVGGGHRLIGWPCSEDPETPNEGFAYDEAQHIIHSTHQYQMGFNVKEGKMSAGGELILWPLDQEEL